MDTKVHCPKCMAALNVPQEAAGRPARCPMCGARFRIPTPDEIFEETISTWIEEDLDELQRHREAYWDDVSATEVVPKKKKKLRIGMMKTPTAPPLDRPPTQAPPPRQQKPSVTTPPDDDDELELDLSLQPRAGELAGATAPPPEQVDDTEEEPAGVAASSQPQPTPDPAPVEAREASPAGVDASGPASADAVTTAAGPTPVSEPVAPVEETAPPAPAAVKPVAPPPSARRAQRARREYVKLGQAPTDRPTLAVESCTTTGVTLSFSANWLEHDGFRASLPLRCAFSGETQMAELQARPLAFIDRSGATVRAAQEIESKYQQKLIAGMKPRDLVASMGKMLELPKPFNSALPYYVSPAFVNSSIKCWTHGSDTGEVTCFVQLPDGGYALDWLGRVNGVCGQDYEMLEEELFLLSSDAWRDLGEEVRKRIEVWCPFEPAERFLIYLSDAEFGSRDRGLAGLVLTDRRLVYCKYHHRGSIELGPDVTIVAKPDGKFVNLVANTDEGRLKIVTLHTEDVPVLAATLKETGIANFEEQSPSA